MYYATSAERRVNILMDKLAYKGAVVLAILDGVGLAPDGPGNAVARARTRWLGKAVLNHPHLAIEASGEAVGLMPGQMGNSEVGHNTMGTGRAVKQGLARMNEQFLNGEIFNSLAWREAMSRVKNGGTLHFAGIFSNGGVHSDIKHLEQMIFEAYNEGVRKMRVHAVFDGRDVGPFTAEKYIKRFEEFIKGFPGADIKIASGGGRMVFVADRYESDWRIVERGWRAMTMGEAERKFQTAMEAISDFREKNPKMSDQDMPPFVITDENGAVGKIEKGDVLIYFDFRADRAVQIARAFTRQDFSYFDRGEYRPGEVMFVGMTEYDADRNIPELRLVEPVKFGKSLSEFLGERGISQLAVSETVKFGHVTYYFNGNSYKKALGEEFVEIESLVGDFAGQPWMRTAEITERVIREMGNYRFIRLNFPGGDMVGHTADMGATVKAIETIDEALSRLATAVDEAGGVLVVVADHGNAEELLDENGEKKTAHTNHKVPFIIYDNTENREKYRLAEIQGAGLKNLAATMAILLGQEDYPQEWAEALIRKIE